MLAVCTLTVHNTPMTADTEQSTFLKTKSHEFVNHVNRLVREQGVYSFPLDDALVAEAMLGVYMDYAEAIENSHERDVAVKAGLYCLELLQTKGKIDILPGAEYDGLPVRRRGGKIATVVVKALVVRKTAEIVGELRSETDAGMVVVQRPSRYGPRVFGMREPDKTVTD